ncbi:MAG: COX15/CtaA family protein [Betaproteobacteria bacterium]|nr:COX15/CtaA family protein [Betaproteobacteria bacterium]
MLALTGLLAALPPLLYVFFSRGEDRYARLAGLTAFLAFDLILFGSFTRLTDSGLGCPDWPGCYGEANPLAAETPILAAQAHLPSGPVTWAKAWIEMVHRYFAMGLGVLALALAGLAWRRWRRGTAQRPWLAFGVLVAVCVQGAFGAFTVTLKLQPAIVTLHLLGGLFVLALLTRLALARQPAPAHAGRIPRRLAGFALAALTLQIGLGGWVSSNYAVLACPDFPLCHGVWLPPMEFSQAFTFWRPLGMTAEGEWLAFPSLVAIHWVHRLGALVTVLILSALIWRVWRLGLTRWARAATLLLCLQGLTGLTNVVWQWPLPLAVAHTGGAALLVMALVWLMSVRRG